MKRYLYKVSVFAVVFYAINSAFAVLICDNLTVNRHNKYHWVRSIEGGSFDHAFVGSSRTEMTVDPLLIDAILCSDSINIGVSGGGAGDQYLLTSSILRNDVNIVFLQLDYLTLSDKFSYPFRDYVWLCYDDDPEVSQALVDHCGVVRYGFWKTVPFLRLMEFSSQYDLFAAKNAGEYWQANRGGQQRDEPHPLSMKDKKASYVPKPLPTMYVKKIIDLCNRKNVELVMFQAPLPGSLSQVSEYSKCTERIREIVREHKLEYWDFSDAFRERADLFYDNHHLNSKGVKLFSEVLASRIQQHRTFDSLQKATCE